MAEEAPQPAYRWMIVFGAALILAIAMGAIVNGMSAFIVPMQERFGWTRGDAALINLAGLVVKRFAGMPLPDCSTRPSNCNDLAAISGSPESVPAAVITGRY